MMRRLNGDGMVRKRGKNEWEGRIVVGHKNNGDSIFRYVYAETQKELSEKLHSLKEEYKGVELNENSMMTLSEWLDIWLEERMKNRIRISTFNTYKQYINLHIKPYLGDKQIAFIKTDDVQKLYNFLKSSGRKTNIRKFGKGLSARTVIGIHRILHQAMYDAQKEHLISKNPTDGTVLPKNERKEMKALNDKQLQILKDTVEKDEQWRDFFYTEITTGMREGEICGLRWSDFDEENGKISVKSTVRFSEGKLYIGETKTGKGTRSFYLPPSTADRLRELKKKSVSEWIFCDPVNPELPVKPETAYRKLKYFLKAAGLPDIRFHDLRHTFATHALQSGVDAKTLSGILGHENASFTLDTYTHVTTDMQKNASEIIGGFMHKIFGDELING